jgi:hypothetical protein
MWTRLIWVRTGTSGGLLRTEEGQNLRSSEQPLGFQGLESMKCLRGSLKYTQR